MVIWLIGLSGSGKTTLANLVVKRIRDKDRKVILLDGDVIREIFGNDVDHSIQGRQKNAERLSMLSKFLSEQGVHVVAAVLSIFPHWRSWNRENIANYSEVYIKTSMQTLIKRDIKNLYSRALNSEIKNVVGVDIPFPEPENPELTIDNDLDVEEFDELVDAIFDLRVIKEAEDLRI